jgi:hypothetical protein
MTATVRGLLKHDRAARQRQHPGIVQPMIAVAGG